MPKQVKIYHRSGECAEMYSVDAREACQRHPDQWRMSRWPAEDVKAAQETADA